MLCFLELGKSRIIYISYFYDVFSTLCPKYMVDMIHSVYAKRPWGKTTPKEDTIQDTPHLLLMFKEVSFVPSSFI